MSKPDWLLGIPWYRAKYLFGALLALALGRVVVAVILPVLFHELADMGRQGWVVTAIGAVFVLGLWALYKHRGIKTVLYEHNEDARFYQQVYSMSIDVMPMLGLFGTVMGLTRFLPTWVAGNPDAEAVKHSFLATGAAVILSAALMFLEGIMRNRESR